MTFVIGSIVIVFTLLFGGLLAFAFSRLDRAVVTNSAKIELDEKSRNPALTMGFDINALAPPDEQVSEARKQAAKMAAAMPRGANFRIGWRENPGGLSASKGVEDDPWTAAKIAKFHGWVGAREGIPSGGVPTEAVAAVAAAPASAEEVELVPGKDYPYIEITDDMSPDEVRKARIANSKAKSAAMKAAKAAGAPLAATTAPIAPAAAAPTAAAVGIEAPKLIKITDDMPPDELRKARIANSKARSAFNKALKAAGIDPQTVEIDEDGNIIMPQGATAPAPVAAPTAAAQPASGAVLANIEMPQFVDITGDMSPDEVRKARIQNSKARAAFNKALKAAGVDPKSVEIGEDGEIKLAGDAAPPRVEPVVPAETAPAPEPVAGDGVPDLAALGLAPPELIEVTDEMSPDEKREARIANSKAKSAFNKALKAAGVDPKSVSY